MSTETLEFLRWLVNQTTVTIGAPESREIAARAFQALDEIEEKLAQGE